MTENQEIEGFGNSYGFSVGMIWYVTGCLEAPFDIHSLQDVQNCDQPGFM